MIELNIPGRGVIQLEHLVSDVNGTLAVDGVLIDGLARPLRGLRDRLSLHLLTADTFGRQGAIDEQLGTQAIRIRSEAGRSEAGRSEAGRSEAGRSEAEQKANYVRQLGAEKVIAIGQGANDALMLREAGLGICVLSNEGTAIETLLAADLVVPDIQTAIELLEKPLRIVATLRK